MYKLLYKLMKEDALVALYTNKNDYESFAVGYINQLIDDKAIILHVGVHGNLMVIRHVTLMIYTNWKPIVNI